MVRSLSGCRSSPFSRLCFLPAGREKASARAPDAGCVRIVGFGRTPVPVDEGEIASLQTVVRSGLLMRPWPFLRAGQMVTLEEGPLRNATGILTEIDGSEQLVVSVSLLCRSLAVAVPRHSIRPVDKRRFVANTR